MLTYWLPWPGKRKAILPLRPAAAAEDTLRFDRLPGLRVVKRHDFARFVHPIQQLCMIAEIDDQAVPALQYRLFCGSSDLGGAQPASTRLMIGLQFVFQLGRRIRRPEPGYRAQAPACGHVSAIVRCRSVGILTCG